MGWVFYTEPGKKLLTDMISQIIKEGITRAFSDWSRPRHLILHVTSRCNSRCGMCFAWKRLNKENSDLNLSEFREISSSLPGLIFLDLSGGEPFLRDDLPEILNTFQKDSPDALVNLPTNGFLPEKIEKETSRILKTTLLSLCLNLSLDGFAATHERIRGVKDGFAKAEETFHRLKKLKEKNRRLSVKINTVISNQNFAELEEFARYVRQTMKGLDFHTLILMRGEPPNKAFALPSITQLKTQTKLFYQIWQHYDHYGQNLDYLGSRIANQVHRYFLSQYLRTLEEKKMTVPCLAGIAHVVIYANGDLSFCELREPIGNLRNVNFNFDKLWHSLAAKKQRLEIKNFSCYCVNGCNWTDNVFFNVNTYPALLKTIILS